MPMESKKKKVTRSLLKNTKDTKPLVFVSCGQSTSAERQLGQDIARLVEQQTGCVVYFAENQNTLEAVTENILKQLHDAVAFIGVMHPRGEVSNPHDSSESSWVRGSVWVEQEIAVAAFISQALQRPMAVRFYVHHTVRREGLRDKLHLHPIEFHEDSEILANLTSFLPAWQYLAQYRSEPLSLRADVRYVPVPVPGGGEDQRYKLLVSIENDGERDATDFRLVLDFPSTFVDEGAHRLRVASSKPGVETFCVTNTQRGVEHVYPKTRVEDLISFHYAIRAKLRRDNPEMLQETVTATVFSGNMKPNTTVKSIAELIS